MIDQIAHVRNVETMYVATPDIGDASAHSRMGFLSRNFSQRFGKRRFKSETGVKRERVIDE